MYETRSESCWGECSGFDCYSSDDLENWDGPFEVFHRPDGFFADRNYWAPEVYYHKGCFSMFCTFGCENSNSETIAMQQELLDKHYLRKHGANAYYGQK